MVVYYRVDVIMLSALAGDTPAGEYAMAYNLLYGPALIMWSLTAAAFPILSSGTMTSGGVRHQVRRLTAIAAGLGAAFMLAIPLADVILDLFYGPAPEAATTSLRILLVAQLFTFVAAVTGTTFNAIGMQRTNLVIVAIAVGLNVALNIAAIPRFGAPGAAVTTVLTEAFVALAGIAVLHRRGVVALSGARADERQEATK